MSAPIAPAPSWTCIACRAEVGGEYFLVGGNRIVCPSCKARVEGLPPGPLLPALAGATLFGLGGAAAGAAGWAAIVLLTHLQIGLVAVAVGWLVGSAVRKGAGQRSGLPFQVLALTLTVVSLAWSTLPLIVRELQTESASPLVTAFALTVGPFLAYAAWCAGDPLSLLFLGFALLQAWRLNRSRTVVFAGPHHRTGAIDFSAR